MVDEPDRLQATLSDLCAVEWQAAWHGHRAPDHRSQAQAACFDHPFPDRVVSPYDTSIRE
jgi:hypothetical protein